MTLYLVGTPIGNLQDMTFRAVEVLKGVDLIAAEDTRESRKLLQHFGIDKPLTAYHEHNRREAGARLLERLKGGETIALVTDAGMPGISDPGEDLAREAIDAGIAVIPIPGPTAFVTALVASGLPTGTFVFEGFLPREPKLRRRHLRDLARETRTMLFYEAPHRLDDTLKDMMGIFGEGRQACVGRELTKQFEEHRRGSLAELLAHFEATPPRGEIVLTVAGGEAVAEVKEGDWQVALEVALAGGARAKDAAKEIAQRFGVDRQEVYKAAARRPPGTSV